MKYINSEIKNLLDMSEDRTGRMENKVIGNIQTEAHRSKNSEKYRKEHNRHVKHMKKI